MRHYHVVENTPGYLPDSDPACFRTMAAARAYMADLARELREDGYHVSGNRRDGYYGERDANDLGRVIECLEADEPCSDDEMRG